MYMGLETHLLETMHKSTIMQLNGTVRKFNILGTLFLPCSVQTSKTKVIIEKSMDAM